MVQPRLSNGRRVAPASWIGLAAATALVLFASDAPLAAELRGRVALARSSASKTASPNPYPGTVSALTSGADRAPAGWSVTDAVIYATPVGGAPRLAARSARGRMPVLPELRQRDQMFVPRVLPVCIGTEVAFPNDDPFYHNVFSYSAAKRFDLGRYGSGKSRTVIFDRPGLVKVFCEIHSDMQAYVLVLETPHFAVPAQDGAYAIEGLAPGEYDVTVWHPDRPEWSTRVAVAAEGATTLDAQVD
jgi:plastocyanin